MANQPVPSDADRYIAHAGVGVGVGALVAQKAGFWGFIIGGAVAIFVHQALDAPAAQLVAGVSQWLKTS